MDLCSILTLAGVDVGNVVKRVKKWKVLLLEVFLLVDFLTKLYVHISRYNKSTSNSNMNPIIKFGIRFINYIMQRGEGGGKFLCYDLIKIVKKLVSLALQRG